MSATSALRRTGPAGLGLGTAQFGGVYGVANAGGRPPRAEVEAILRAAAAAGIAVLDTAPAYGEAEQVLGMLRPSSDPFGIVTKTVVGAGADAVRPNLLRSLARLGRRCVDTLLVHDRRELLGADGPALFAALERVRDEGLARSVGVSVYEPDEALAIVGRLPVQVVQLPLNVLDQRALRREVIARLGARGVAVQARSAFLQGLLLLPPQRIPAGLAAAVPLVTAFQQRAGALGLSPVAAALGFARSVAGVELVVCGVDTRQQLTELVAAANVVDPSAFEELATGDAAIVDPSRWPVPR